MNKNKSNSTRKRSNSSRKRSNLNKRIMKGGRLQLERNVSPQGNGYQLGNDIINLVFSSINTITDTITTVVDVVDLSSNMGSEFSSPFSPGA